MSDSNANKPGYEETKVGWIPEEWESVCAGELCATITKGTTPRSRGDKVISDPVPFLRVQNLSFDGRLRFVHEPLYIERAIHETELARSKVFPGDVLMNLVGPPLGKVGWVTNKYPEWNINQAIAVFRVNAAIKAIFLIYFLQSYRAKWWLDSQSKKTSGQKNLTLESCRELPVPTPPLSEQIKIVEIFSTCDKALEKTGTLIAAKEEQKKALMQQLLTGKIRLPGFGGKAGRTSYHFFDLPSDWECPQVGEISQEHSERNGESVSHTVLTCSKHLGFVESKAYFKKQVFSEDLSNYKVVRRDWFGFPSNHVEEGSIGLLSTHDSGVVSPIYTVFEVNDKIHPDYLYAIFKTETYRHIFSVTTNASVDRRGSLRWDAFSRIRVPCPLKDEQVAIAEILSAAEQELDVLRRQLDVLRLQKRGLMQKLLTGEVRVTI